jgi:hypothetical protein
VTHGGGQVGGAMVVDNAGGLVVINSDFFDNNSTCHTTLADHITVPECVTDAAIYSVPPPGRPGPAHM